MWASTGGAGHSATLAKLMEALRQLGELAGVVGAAPTACSCNGVRRHAQNICAMTTCRHRRRHVHCAGRGVPVLKTTASAPARAMDMPSAMPIVLEAPIRVQRVVGGCSNCLLMQRYCGRHATQRAHSRTQRRATGGGNGGVLALFLATFRGMPTANAEG